MPLRSKAQSIAKKMRSSDGLAAPSTAPNMAINVSSWLQELGLERYEEAFLDNDVDGDVLPDLTAEDLIGIGVTSIGHRRKLLAAIAAIGPDVSTVARCSAAGRRPSPRARWTPRRPFGKGQSRSSTSRPASSCATAQYVKAGARNGERVSGLYISLKGMIATSPPA
jgi:hypothetical protein